MKGKQVKKTRISEVRLLRRVKGRTAMMEKGAKEKAGPRRKKNFMLVDLSILNRPNLSWRAKGLMTYLLSKVESEEKVTYRSLLAASSDQEEDVLKTIQELIDTEYALPDFLKRIK